LAHNTPFVIIEQSEEIIEKIRAEGDLLYMQGDATDDELLISAGIQRAQALITTLPSDSNNLFVVLTARDINKTLTIISRASQMSSKRKLKIAGATNVIMPDSIGGSHMAQLVTNPDVLEFIDQISMQGKNEINLEEICFADIPEDCKYKSLFDLKKQFPYCNIVGFRTPEKEYIINPPDTINIIPNCKIFVLGNPEQIRNLNQSIGIS